MSDQGAVQLLALKLELEQSPGAIHGILEHPDGRRRPFWGWLELMGEVEHLVGTAPVDRIPPSPDTNDAGSVRAR